MSKGGLLPENNQRTRYLSFDEEDKLFAKLIGERKYLRPLVTVAIYAGPRRGELLKLRWSNVDFGLNLINFTETKTNRNRAVPMEPIVREALLELSEQSGNAVRRQLVFPLPLPHPGMLPNYGVPHSPILSTPRWAGAKRSPVEQSEAGRSGAPGPSRAYPKRRPLRSAPNSFH